MSAVARPTVVYNKMHSSQSRQTKDALEHDGIKIRMLTQRLAYKFT